MKPSSSLLLGFALATVTGAVYICGLLVPSIQEQKVDAEYRVQQIQAEHKSELEWSEARNIVCSDLFRSHTRLSEAMEKVGSIPYSNPGNNCYDHSRALVNELDEQGILSFIAVTEDWDGDGLGNHAYVLVAVEANTGELAPGVKYLHKDYQPINEIRDKNLKVICK